MHTVFISVQIITTFIRIKIVRLTRINVYRNVHSDLMRLLRMLVVYFVNPPVIHV